MRHYALTMLLTGAGLLTACGGVGVMINDPGADRAGTSSGTGDYAEEYAATETVFPADSGLPDLLDFTAKTLDGGTFTAADFSDADVTVINIWSTTCGPCIREMPDIATYADSLPDNVKLMTWCLDADYSPDADKIGGFLADCGFDGITLVSGDGDLQTLYNALTYTPTTVFVDSSGNMLTEPLIGAVDIEKLYTAHINKALETLGKETIA